jgi:septum formation protein
LENVLLKTNSRIFLASASPRRKVLLKELLKNFGLKFIVKPANITEYYKKHSVNYSSYVKKLAYKKAKKVSEEVNGVVIGADTIVVLDGKILGKPKNQEHAKTMLRSLSNRKHKVYTGICLLDVMRRLKYLDYELTFVKFRKLLNKEIEYYVNSGIPLDKAGSYGIQDDLGSTFVENIDGDYFNIVGLPLLKTYVGLKNVLNNKN